MAETDKDRVTMQDHKEIRKQMLSQMEQKLMKMVEGEPFSSQRGNR